MALPLNVNSRLELLANYFTCNCFENGNWFIEWPQNACRSIEFKMNPWFGVFRVVFFSGGIGLSRSTFSCDFIQFTGV